MKDKNIVIEAIQESTEKEAAQFIEDILHQEFHDIVHHLDADDLKNLHTTYTGNRNMFLILKDGDKIIGTVGIKEDSYQVALLRRLFIDPAYRNRGYGSKLVQKAIEFCKEHGYEMICFRGNNQMDNALRVIEKHNFIKKDIIDFGLFHMYIYVKLL